AERYEEAIVAKHRASFRSAVEAGVTIGVGSDSILEIPETDATLCEIEALIDAGMSPVDALRAATINGAKIIGIDDDTGSLEPGKLADVIAVDGDPLQVPRVLERPAMVLKQGELLVDRREV